jgi:transposase-like protein
MGTAASTRPWSSSTPPSPQACWVHVLRHVAQRLRVRDRDRCLALAGRIDQARSGAAAETAVRQWARAQDPIAPAAVACLLHVGEALPAFCAVPERDWRRVRSIHAINRAFREVRRRTRPITCFTHGASCDRITSAVVHYVNAQWQGRPRWWDSTQDSLITAEQAVQRGGQIAREFLERAGPDLQ